MYILEARLKTPDHKKAMSECADFLNAHPASVEREIVFDAGGGFFSPYAGDEVDHELKVYADAIHEGIKEHWSGSYKVMIEPGRALVNNPESFYILLELLKMIEVRNHIFWWMVVCQIIQGLLSMEVNISFLISLVAKLKKMSCMQSLVGTVKVEIY